MKQKWLLTGTALMLAAALAGCGQQEELRETQRQLEQYMAVKPSTINGIVGRLEEKGLLTRDACQQDARCRVLRLTEEGRRFRSDFIRIAQDTNRQMEQGFSPEELAALHRYLERVAQNLAAQTEETEL